MKKENLTQAEAARRSELLTVSSYDVHIDLTHAADQTIKTYPTTTTVRFSAAAGSETFIDYIHHSLDLVKLNGTTLDHAKLTQGSRIHLPQLAAQNTLTIMGRSYYSQSGEGLHRYFDPHDGKVYLYTQYEPADCRRVFPNFEQPDLKAVFNFCVTAHKDWVVESNAPLQSTVPDPADSNISKRIFAPTQKISTYITSILAGQYYSLEDSYQPTAQHNSGPLTLRLFCRQSLRDHLDASNIFKVSKAGLDYFQDLFAYPYPYPKYDQAFVPEYNLGAMENPGLVTFTEAYLFESGATQAQLESRANVIYHEMSHMWFGDLVTMKWWNDLWLKESFAEYMGTLAAAEAAGFKESWVTFANRRKSWAYKQDQLPSSHPIVGDVPHLEAARQNFDGITYAKGSSVIKQLVAYLGFTDFIAAIRLYFQRHAWSNTSLEDFLTALDQTTSRDIFSWATAWLQTSGLSSIQTERSYSSDGQLKEFYLNQLLPQGKPSQLGRPHRLELETYRWSGQELAVTENFKVEIPAGPNPKTQLNLKPEQLAKLEEADLLLVNAQDLTYAKVLLSPEDGLASALKSVSSIKNPLSRGLIWGSLWNQVRDASLTSSTFVQAVAQHLSGEQSATILSNILDQGQSAISLYTPAHKRPQLWQQLYQACYTSLRQAQPGSDTQLILLRALLAISLHTHEGLADLKDIASGAQEKNTGDIALTPGLPHHQSLGWSALIALAARNSISQEELDQARKNYPSSIAERGYAYASAAFPQAQTKQAAFSKILYDNSISNEILTATAQGFQTGPQELRSDYTAPLLADLEEIWQNRSIGMATRLISGLFPQEDYRAELPVNQHPSYRAVADWLQEHPQAPSALIRLVREELAGLERSLTGQQFNS